MPFLLRGICYNGRWSMQRLHLTTYYDFHTPLLLYPLLSKLSRSLTHLRLNHQFEEFNKLVFVSQIEETHREFPRI